jgi:hypothetical protein
MKQKIYIFLHAEGFLNARKDIQTSFGVQCSTMNAFCTKPFLQLRYTEHKFCILLHTEGFLNAPKHKQTAFSVHLIRMDAFGVKAFAQLQYTKYCIQAWNTSFASFYMPKVS